LWRFRGIGNSQADANRIAYTWLQQNAPDSDFREIEVVPVMIESVQESLNEIAPIMATTFAGGKDMLGMFQTPAKKHLKPLPGGTDLQYAIESNRYGSIVQIVDPGMPGITRPEVVAVLNLEPVQYYNLPNTVQVGSITVDEDYRGRGLAKALYGIVLTIMQKNLVSGSSQTPGGRKNWLSLASIPGVEVKGLVRIPNQVFDPERIATVSPQYKKYAQRTMDQIMELGGQFYHKDNHSTYWLFDVVPGKGGLQPAVRNVLSKLYGYDSDALLMAKWTGV
jgi:GNAT superfamily N-acetyltransferase